ncbi:MAG: entericidin EcnAB [Candidatus Marinarcus sp.]|uniref:entericidin EcnAB n=1 Tax=Candidatus Marinarcus sp. TaxID=3100987 RepID=UPI003B001A58
MKKVSMFILTLLLGTLFLGCSKTWEGVKEDSSTAWEKTKEGTKKAVDVTKEKIHEATE